MSRVPPHASAFVPGASPGDELEQLEELGDDAIIAQQQGAHAPASRAQVTEEARSVVISDHPALGSNPPADLEIPRSTGGSSGTRRHSDRTEKTVVIRDRRQIEELRRQMDQRRPQSVAEPANRGILLWVIVGVAAFAAGGLLALLATRDDAAAPVVMVPSVSVVATPKAAPSATAEPPSVSIDELPIEKK